MTKEAEKRVRDLTNHYEWYRHKYGDVRYCIHCKKPLPKTERAPDFYIAQIGDWVEAKNNDSTGTWRSYELSVDGERANQRKFLEYNNGWLFIEFSDGRAPDNVAAYLIPFATYRDSVEPILEKEEMKSFKRLTTYNKDGSVRRYGADILLAGYELEWEANVGWVIPYGHSYWYSLKEKVKNLLQYLEEVTDEKCL